ncbi:uncharacterized protein [Diadema antillarum]|uniref:uncharacterized protein n=1 Tax=Diadema antillarum TaxID=105358 RepID=UPI003A886A2F
MGLVIGVTACCCAYCFYKKKKKQRLGKDGGNDDDAENDDDLEAQIPGGQSMMRDDFNDVTLDEINTEERLEDSIGVDRGPPPTDRQIGIQPSSVEYVEEEREADDIKRSSGKHKYKSLTSPESEDELEKIESSDTIEQESHHQKDPASGETAPTPGDEFLGEVIDAVAGAQSEDDDVGSGPGGARKSSSKRYRYSPLKGPQEKERKRIKSGDDQQEYEEINTIVADDVHITTPPTYV